MEVTAEHGKAPYYDFRDQNRTYNELYDVTIGATRTLAIYTDGDLLLSKWISEVRKAHRTNKTPLAIALRADRDIRYGRRGLFDNPYQVLTLSVGANCLIYQLPRSRYYHNLDDWPYCTRGPRRYNSGEDVPRALKEFFSDPKIVFVGVDMEEFAAKMYRDFRVEVARFLDVRDLVEKVSREEGVRMREKELKRLGVQEITKRLLGKEKCVRKYERLRWGGWEDSWDRGADLHNVRFLAADTYLFHEMAIKYMEDVKKLSRSMERFE